MKKLILTVAAAAGLLTAIPAAAQFAKPDDAIRYRKAAFTLMGTHFGRVAAMTNGRAPFDAKAAVDNAELATMLSKLPFTAFPAGSEGGNSKAKPEVWTEQEKFNAGAVKMQDEMVKLSAAAKTGNLEAIRTAAGAVGQSCKACHDNYKKE